MFTTPLRAKYDKTAGWLVSIFYDTSKRKMVVFQYDHGGLVILPISVIQLAED